MKMGPTQTPMPDPTPNRNLETLNKWVRLERCCSPPQAKEEDRGADAHERSADGRANTADAEGTPAALAVRDEIGDAAACETTNGED